MASPSPVTAAQIEAYLATATSAYRSMRTHPRYHARSRSLVAIAVGSVLNFIGLIVAFVGDDREDAPKYVAVWVGIVVSFLLAEDWFRFLSACRRFFPPDIYSVYG